LTTTDVPTHQSRKTTDLSSNNKSDADEIQNIH